VVFVSHTADGRSAAYARCVAPARFRGLPGIAYRLALVGTGEGVAAISLHPPHDWDFAGAHAIVRGAGGVLLDEHGAEVTYSERGESHCQACFGGAPAVVRELAGRSWQAVLSPSESSPPKTASLRIPARRRAAPGAALARAQGCLLGQLAGDALGSLVEFESAASIRRQYPHGVTELADGGTWDTIAGQPTDDSELALLLARALVEQGGFDLAAIARAYGYWYASDPFDMGGTIGKALGAAATAVARGGDAAQAAQGAASRTSQANGSLMRVSPLGIIGAGQPEQAAEWARRDSALSHPHAVCLDACAAFVSAISAAVGQGAEPNACVQAAIAASPAEGPVLAALERARAGEQPDNPQDKQGWVLIALQNAFYQLLHAPTLRDGVTATVMIGGDTDTNAAIAGALLGAVHGREALPQSWRNAVLSCRPIRQAGAHRPRPVVFWPVDALEIAEELLALSACA
jgi:ADP-ribosylglycohydrolase